MNPGEWLYTVAVRHERLQTQHQEWLSEGEVEGKLPRHIRGNIDLRSIAGEFALQEAVIGDSPAIPKAFAKLKSDQTLLLAHLFKQTLNGDTHVTGIELIAKVMVDDEHTHHYLQQIHRLVTAGWIAVTDENSDSYLGGPPYCYLHNQCDFGDRFHELLGAAAGPAAPFDGNEQYLESMFGYLQRLQPHGRHPFKLCGAGENPERRMLEPALRRLEERVRRAQLALPAFDLRQQFGLSSYQHLCLLGMYGQQEGEIDHDFSDPNDVVKLFSRGIAARELLRDHLYGEESPLLRQRLIEGEEAHFGRQFKLSRTAVTAILGRAVKTSRKSVQIKELVKRTIFEAEQPKVRAEAVFLPEPVLADMDAIASGETPRGRRQRRQWRKDFPSDWGAPSGTTILLYGPPGTGKTLTAQLLASRLKRPLLTVDASKVLGMWVGQSEKSVRQIFDEYRELMQQLKSAPVLLFNEADQLLGARGKSDSAVDKMHNNMQNLFLEGLERFEGLLIATTNRRDLLDQAFSRRFTYKWELPAPDATLRRAIWAQHLPAGRLAPEVELERLAELGLTGGEIRLVVEQAVRRATSRGVELLGHELLESLARQELSGRFDRKQSGRSIGF